MNPSAIIIAGLMGAVSGLITVLCWSAAEGIKKLYRPILIKYKIRSALKKGDISKLLEIYPDIEKQKEYLKLFSFDLANEYTSKLLKDKNYLIPEKIAQDVLQKYLEKRFNKNDDAIVLGKKLLELGDYKTALQLEQLANQNEKIAKEQLEKFNGITEILRKKMAVKNIESVFLNDGEFLIVLNDCSVIGKIHHDYEYFDDLASFRSKSNCNTKIFDEIEKPFNEKCTDDLGTILMQFEKFK